MRVMWHDDVLGANMMIAMPARHTMTPTRSQRLGRTPSTSQSQQIATVMHTQPYAEYTRPFAVGCYESNHADNDRLAAADNNHADLPRFGLTDAVVATRSGPQSERMW